MKKSKKYVWLVVALIGAYIGCQAVADVAVTKFTQIGMVVIPSGGLMYAFTFTLRDLIHKRLGKEWARATIVVAGVFNVFQAGFLYLMSTLPAPAWFELGDAWSQIFAILPFITAGSIIAEVISELVDTEVYQLIWQVLGEKYQWLRVLGSNIAGIVVDGLLFAPLSFTILPFLFGATTRPLMTSLTMGFWGKVVQMAVMLVSIPWIYLVKSDPDVK